MLCNAEYFIMIWRYKLLSSHKETTIHGLLESKILSLWKFLATGHKPGEYVPRTRLIWKTGQCLRLKIIHELLPKMRTADRTQFTGKASTQERQVHLRNSKAELRKRKQQWRIKHEDVSGFFNRLNIDWHPNPYQTFKNSGASCYSIKISPKASN